MQKISAYARKLSTDRARVMGELAMVAITCQDPNLRETDLKRLNLRRVTLSRIYEYLTDRVKEEQHQRLIESVEAVENLWGHGMEDVADRESFAAKFSDTKSPTTH